MTATVASEVSELGIMERLKTETADLHRAAERSDFQAMMMGGRLPRDAYVAFLGQMYLVHRALESGLRRVAADTLGIRQTVQDYQYQEPYLARDLAYFGVDPASVTPLRATATLIEHIEQQVSAGSGVSLLGLHYVLEGSNNGSKYIAMAVSNAYGLPPGQGVSYLDPYGDRLHANWGRFKQDMSSVPFSPAEMTQIVVAAKAMFVGIVSIGEGLLEHFGISVSPEARAAAVQHGHGHGHGHAHGNGHGHGGHGQAHGERAG